MPDKIHVNWREAKGPSLADHAVGDLCKDSEGNQYLVGDVENGTDEAGGCGCCACPLTNRPIVTYVPLLEYVEPV
jgi:hypothetical protein